MKKKFILFLSLLELTSTSFGQLLNGEFMINDSIVIDSLICPDYDKLTYKFRWPQKAGQQDIYGVRYHMVFTDVNRSTQDRGTGSFITDQSFTSYSCIWSINQLTANLRNGWVTLEIVNSQEKGTSKFEYKTFGPVADYFDKARMHDAGTKQFEKTMKMYLFVEVNVVTNSEIVTEWDGTKYVTRTVNHYDWLRVGDSKDIPVTFIPKNVEKYKSKNPEYELPDMNCYSNGRGISGSSGGSNSNRGNGSQDSGNSLPDGPYEKKNSSGELVESGQYLNGKKTGEWKTYWSGGGLWEVINYSDGMKNGEYKVFHPKGYIEKSAEYVNDTLHGTYKEYGSSGSGAVTLSKEYKMGKLHGTTKKYSGGGSITSSTEYENDQKHGVEKEYYGGKLSSITTYKNGKKDGEYTKYKYDSVYEKGEYKDGMKHGEWKIFNSAGEVTSTTVYDEGVPVE